MIEIVEYLQKKDNLDKFFKNNVETINELKKYNIYDVETYSKFLELEIFKYNKKNKLSNKRYKNSFW